MRGAERGVSDFVGHGDDVYHGAGVCNGTICALAVLGRVGVSVFGGGKTRVM